MRSSLLFAACAALSACASTDAPIEQRESVSGMLCKQSAAAQFVGRRASAEAGAEIQAASGAASFQWVPPDSAVTMDFRPDRVRVHYDRDMAITRVACG